MKHFRLLLLLVSGILCCTSSYAQSEKEKHPLRKANKNPWYAPSEPSRYSTVIDVSFSPTDVNMVKPAPAAAQATRYADYPVSYCIGQTEVSIPLYEIKSRSLSLPIYLSYDSGGVRVDDVSGLVGLNWTLEAGGVITRSVNAMDDTDIYGWSFTHPVNPLLDEQYMEQVSKGERDSSADRYSYSFCGQRGSFYIDWTTNPASIISTTATDLDIQVSGLGFTITSSDGTKYYFTEQEETSRWLSVPEPFPGSGNPNYAPQSTVPITAWYLTRIESMDGTDKIDFSYQTFTPLFTLHTNETRTYTFTYNYVSQGSYQWDTVSGHTDVEECTGEIDTECCWEPLFLKSVTYAGGKVEFGYSNNPIPSNSYRRHSYPKLLTSIQVKPQSPVPANLTTIRNCAFTYVSTNDSRNLLRTVTITGYNSAAVESYTLSYINESTNMVATSKDLFGYYNGASNSSGTSFLRLYDSYAPLYEPVADRGYNSYYASALSLETITTASGSKTKFVYEGNSISNTIPGTLFSTIGIGHRIKRIITYDLSSGSEVTVRQREFSYSSPSITIPLVAFSRQAFTSASEIFREDLVDGHPWWCGTSNPIPRTAIVAFSDQSILSGIPLEGARICYGTVTERISAPFGSSGFTRTDYDFAVSNAEHTQSWGTLPTQYQMDTHDNANNSQNLHSYHFYQRLPQYVPYNNYQTSTYLSTPSSFYVPEDFPQLSFPIHIRRYKTVGNSEILVSQTDNEYASSTELFLTGYQFRKLIDAGDEYCMADIHHTDDFYQAETVHRRVWHRLTRRTETEWLDDSSSHSVVTTFAYGSSGFPSSAAVLSPTSETLVFDGNISKSFQIRYVYPSDLSATITWAAALVSRGYKNPVRITRSIVQGTTDVALAMQEVIWGNFTAIDSTALTMLRPSQVNLYRKNPEDNAASIVGPGVQYRAYDRWGNPLEIRKEGEPIRTYLWGFRGKWPVLEVKGDSLSHIRNVIGTTTWNNLAIGAPTEQQLSNIRTSLEVSGDFSRQVSWYHYGSPFGMTSTSDVSGRITRYSYDGVGRLANVKDENDKLINSYIYDLTVGSGGSPNSITSITHTVAGTSISTAGVKDVAYFDGLGRTLQTVAVAASIENKDLITPFAPDFLDREDARMYVPYPDQTSATAGSYRSNALSAQQSFYGIGVKAYTENTYETSVRGRIIASSLPGFTETTSVSTSSSASNTILNLSYDQSNNTLTASGYYPQGRFIVTTSSGPDGSQTMSLTDEYGTPVLERVKLDANSTYADTYYIKDAIGHVLCVVPPDQAALLSSSTSGFSAVNCYTYEYDGRDRVIRKQLPGQAAETYTYNGADLPLTRTRTAADGNAVEVYSTTYDAFNRPIQNTYRYGNNTAVTLAEYAYDCYPSWGPSFVAESGYVSNSDKDTRTRGLPTAERITLLPGGVSPSSLTPSNTTARTDRAFYYDAKGNVRQVAQADATGGTTRTSSSYGFTGNLLAERQRIAPASGQTEHTLDRTYTYDGRLRQASVSASLDGGSAASQTYSYGLRQQLNVINRANDLEKTTLGYTLQDWLTTANSTSWEETLRYQSPSRTATDALPGKAGLITEWTQQQKGTSADGATTAETYAYTYDKAGRLTGSLRYIDTSTSAVNTLTEQDISYDRSGNLLTLNRYDASSGTTPSESLSFSYSGPKRSGWSYDSHGNVTSDPVGSTTMAWNVLDMPSTISSGTAGVQRSYLADGTLVQVNDGSTTRLYLGDMVFNQTSGTISLESAGWDGGRLLPGSGTDKVLYYVTDHLGSVRVVKDGSGNIRQRYDYYPYGSVSRSWSSSSTSTPDKRYRFGGKEITGTALGALSSGADKYLDFGARLYSPGTAMWLSQDPLAEKYYPLAPYIFCAGSPENVVDPEGRTIIIWYSNNGQLCSFVFSGVETDIPDNDYVKSVIEAYYYNKANWQKAGFKGNSPSTELVESQDIKIGVYEDLSFDSKYYRGNGGIPYLIWNPAEGLMSENGTVLSPSTIFAHEADHALDDLKDAKAHSDRVSQRLEGYTNQEEFRVITGSEQLTARANGEIAPGQVTRYNHKGKTVYTSGVASNVVDPSATRFFYKYLFKSRRVW